MAAFIEGCDFSSSGNICDSTTFIDHIRVSMSTCPVCHDSLIEPIQNKLEELQEEIEELKEGIEESGEKIEGLKEKTKELGENLVKLQEAE